MEINGNSCDFTYASPEVDKPTEIVVRGVGSTELVREENEDSNESKLWISHIELVEIDVRLLLVVIGRLTSQSNIRAASQFLSVLLKTGQHGGIVERLSAIGHCRVVNLTSSIGLVHLIGGVIVHAPHHLDGSPSRMILLPDVSEIPGRDVNHRPNVALERFQDSLGFLRENKRLEFQTKM